MKKIKLLLLPLLITIIGVSCDNNSTGEDNQEATVEQDKQNIQQSLDATIASIQDLESGDFSSMVKSFAGMSSGSVNNEDWVFNVVSGLSEVVDVQSTSDNRQFDFSSHTGVYTWDANNQSWSKTSSSNNIVLEFPSSPNASGNDMEFVISNYGDVSTMIDGERYYLPEQVSLELSKDGSRVFGIGLNSITYADDDQAPVPVNLDLEIYTAPFTHSWVITKNSDTNYSYTQTISTGDEQITQLDLDLTTSNNDWSNFYPEDMENITGTWTLPDGLELQFDIDYGTLATYDDPSENEINSAITAEVHHDGEKIGDLEYSSEENNIVIFYKDGSSEPITNYTEDFLDDLEMVLLPFIGQW